MERRGQPPVEESKNQKIKKEKKGFLSALSEPAKKLAKTTAFLTAVSLGADTVRPPDKRSVEQLAEQLEDSRQAESRRKNDEEEYDEIGGISDV